MVNDKYSHRAEHAPQARTTSLNPLGIPLLFELSAILAFDTTQSFQTGIKLHYIRSVSFQLLLWQETDSWKTGITDCLPKMSRPVISAETRQCAKTFLWRVRIDVNVHLGFASMRDLELQSLRSLRTVPLICLKVTSLSAKETSITVSLKDTVGALKNKVLGSDFSKESPSYKLVVSKSNRVLKDENSLEDEGIQEDGKRKDSLVCTLLVFLRSWAFHDSIFVFCIL